MWSFRKTFARQCILYGIFLVFLQRICRESMQIFLSKSFYICGSIETFFAKLWNTFLAYNLPGMAIIAFVFTWNRFGCGETTFMTSWTIDTFIIPKEIIVDAFPIDSSTFIAGNFKILSERTRIGVLPRTTNVSRRTS